MYSVKTPHSAEPQRDKPTTLCCYCGNKLTFCFTSFSIPPRCTSSKSLPKIYSYAHLRWLSLVSDVAADSCSIKGSDLYVFPKAAKGNTLKKK